MADDFRRSGSTRRAICAKSFPWSPLQSPGVPPSPGDILETAYGQEEFPNADPATAPPVGLRRCRPSQTQHLQCAVRVLDAQFGEVDTVIRLSGGRDPGSAG